MGVLDARPLNYLFVPLLFRHWKRKPKKGVQKGRDKVIVSQLPVKKIRISWRI